MQAEHSGAATLHGWRRELASAMYHAGLLKTLRIASQHFELEPQEGGRPHLRRVRKPKYVVLGYHSVGEDGLPLYCRLPRRVFAEQMRYLSLNYRVISLRQMVEELDNPPGSVQSVIVTFDDGYTGTYAGAFPILKQYSIPATIYLMTGSIETGDIPWYDRVFLQFQQATSDLTLKLETTRTFRLNGFASRVEAATAAVMYLRGIPDEERRIWCETLDRLIPLRRSERCMMTWEQIREMQAAGISFGCHTMNHPVLSRLSRDAVRREVAESKWLIENRLNVTVNDFAFPFGKPKDCGSIGAETFEQLGLQTAMTTIVGINEPGCNRYRLRRIVQGNETSLAMFAYRLQRLFFHPEDEELVAHAGPAEGIGN